MYFQNWNYALISLNRCREQTGLFVVRNMGILLGCQTACMRFDLVWTAWISHQQQLNWSTFNFYLKILIIQYRRKEANKQSHLGYISWSFHLEDKIKEINLQFSYGMSFHNESSALTSLSASREQSGLFVLVNHPLEGVNHEPQARGGERMPEWNTASPIVHPLHGQRAHRLVQAQSVLAKGFGFHRPNAH